MKKIGSKKISFQKILGPKNFSPKNQKVRLETFGEKKKLSSEHFDLKSLAKRVGFRKILGKKRHVKKVFGQKQCTQTFYMRPDTAKKDMFFNDTLW